MEKASLGTLHSMTGFGRGSASNLHANAEMELRTVNGKGLNIKLRLPSDRADLETDLEARLRRSLTRGSLQGFLRLRLLSQSTQTIDSVAVRAHLKEWRKTAKELGLRAADPTLSELLAMPGSYSQSFEPQKISRGVEKASQQALKEALGALIESRRLEGARLGEELLRLLKQLESALTKARKRVPKALAEAQKRMQSRVDSALRAAKLEDGYDLSRELVALADRADVQEEVARLDIHLARFYALLARGGAVAREMEFLLQECHREITTLGNKSADVALSQHVVTMKLIAGQLKEQVANLE